MNDATDDDPHDNVRRCQTRGADTSLGRVVRRSDPDSPESRECETTDGRKRRAESLAEAQAEYDADNQQRRNHRAERYGQMDFAGLATGCHRAGKGTHGGRGSQAQEHG